MENVTVPDYYQKFQCIGPRCEDTCCSGGWNVSIDRETYYKYKQNKHKELAPKFKIAVVKNTMPSADSANNFGLMKMKSSGECHFQQDDGLCAIHSMLGPQALSDTCRIYPRYLNQVGSHRENSLGVSCPEAARLILLNPHSMQFESIASDPGVAGRSFTSYRFPLSGDGDPEQIAVLNDFRALIIAILQFRQVSVGARMMLLGFLLDETNQIVSSATFGHASEFLPTLELFAGMLSNPDQIEAQFGLIDADIQRKINSITGLISQALMSGASPRFNQCLLAAADGLAPEPGNNLLGQYIHSYENYYLPYMKGRAFIFENYLVNQVVTRLFPFTRGAYLDLYRELVFNLAIAQVLLVGMAASYKGLNDAIVIQLFQSFARKSDHKRGYLDILRVSLSAGKQETFASLMWLLKE